MAPTIAFSDPPPSPPIRREKGLGASQPMVAKTAIGQNFWADWADMAAMIENVIGTP
jgi:hypothetical protein